MLDQKIIAPSCSAWSCPIFTVQKKDGSTRLVSDMRAVNNVTRKDSYPLPLIQETLSLFHNKNYFTSLDFFSGFLQVGLTPEASSKTAFSCHLGQFEYLVMPFGLTNGPAIFQRLMDFVFAQLIKEGICHPYMDDLILPAESLNQHNENLQKIFDVIRKANLKLKPSKCHFLQSNLNFLGYRISEKGIQAQPSKTEAITNFPVPKNTKQVRSFLGLANFYSGFIENFAAIARPLHKLTSKKIKFVWSPESQAAFDTLKSKLTNPPILAYPDFTKTFRITTDAGNTALGIILSQNQNSKEVVVSYGGRALTNAESKYNTTEKELCAIIYALKKFRSYIYGSKFEIYTDHQPLKYLKSLKNPQGRLGRWMLTLGQHDFDILYKPGKLNFPADVLNRKRLSR